jgi:hypothetical protein
VLTQIIGVKGAVCTPATATLTSRSEGQTMPPFSPMPLRRLRFAAATSGFILIGVSAAAHQRARDPSGGGRVWFYRVLLPEDTGDMPAVAVNGNTIGYARAGWSFYRDLPAGPYHVTVASFQPSSGWVKDIVLQPGTQVALAIQASPNTIASLGGFRRGTYDVTAEPGGAAYQHIAQTQFGTGY